MSVRIEHGDYPLLEIVRKLENQSNRVRGRLIQAELQFMGVQYHLQESRLLKIINIIVDIAPASTAKKLLFSAHYDAVKGSPGANDNASGVAVLVGLCQKLKVSGVPARIVFFDREEAWFKSPLLRLGLLGSLYYAVRTDLKDISAVFNLEFCGLGEVLGVWPIKQRERELAAVKQVEAAAKRLDIDIKWAHLPWFILSSDHLTFRLRGISNSLTLSLLPGSQIPALEKMVSGLNWRKILFRGRTVLPQPLFHIHSNQDNSSKLSEHSLQRTLSLLIEVIKEESNRQLAENSTRKEKEQARLF